MGFYDLQFAVVLGKEFFDVLSCLIVHDIQFWLEVFSSQLFEIFLVCMKYADIVQSSNGCGEDGIGFVAV